MTIKASGRSALILAAGLFVCFAASQPATAAGANSAATASKSETATSGKSVRQAKRHWKRYAHRKYARASSKSAETRNAVEKSVADASPNTPPAIPASVANANAQMQMTSADVSRDSANAITAKASTILLAGADKPADAQAPTDAAVVASDQLNDVDRALQESPSKRTVALAVVKPTPSTAPVLASSNEPSAWDQTSLIGKIFIAFGALLTMASAARMFMA